MSQATFTIQTPFNIVTSNAGVLEQVNAFLSLSAEPKQIDVIYSIAVNAETGLARVEAKEKTDDARIDILTIDVPLRMPDAVVTGTTKLPVVYPLFSIGECVQNVIRWSTDRGILDNGVWFTQGTKLYEEDGEAATGIGKNKHPLIMDGVGNALVVLVNLMELTGYPATDIVRMVNEAREQPAKKGNAHYLFHKMRLHITTAVDHLWDMGGLDSPKKLKFDHFDNGTKENLEYHYGMMIANADALANAYDMSLEQCFSLAWNEIKDRKGFLNEDGIFIKEADAK